MVSLVLLLTSVRLRPCRRRVCRPCRCVLQGCTRRRLYGPLLWVCCVRSGCLRPHAPISRTTRRVVILFRFHGSLLCRGLRTMQLSFCSSLRGTALLSLRPISYLRRRSRCGLPGGDRLLQLTYQSWSVSPSSIGRLPWSHRP